MASTAQIIIDPITGRKTVNHAVDVAVASQAVSEVVTLDGTFDNDPTMMVVVPLASDGTDWAAAYSAGGPTITITVSDEAALDALTIPIVLVAVDRTR